MIFVTVVVEIIVLNNKIVCGELLLEIEIAASVQPCCDSNLTALFLNG